MAQGEHWSYEADGDALRKFRGLSDSEREESLFMAQLSMIRKLDGVTYRLDTLNGSVAKTRRDIDVHIEMHKFEEREVAFVKRWGARGTGLLGVLIAAATGVVVVVDKLWR